jgi:site-specific DNA recombinase
LASKGLLKTVSHDSSPPRRCAIYTRKSSEEGLTQDFNSLHAQREACESYINSQHGVGWRLISTAYDDGGLSGGSMERPALRRLLSAVEQGQVDIIVVYKVDRLTRSLADFAKMVEIFDAHKVSFVAVTQQFNTTTSMGRLTLNVLLSFAQFEREVTGERIRDKIAASKKRGMWMGGFVPVGYLKRDRRLVVDEQEVATVRMIFRRYNELGSVRLLKEDLDRRGLVSKVRMGKNGLKMGGKTYSRGKLYKLLSNPIYKGEIRHLKTCHPGQHEPIIDSGLWEKAQQLLARHAVRRMNGTGTTASPLAGRLFDERGQALTSTHAVKKGRRHRYYVSRRLLTEGPGGVAERSWRLPAPEIEHGVAASAATLLEYKAGLVTAIQQRGIEAERIVPILERAAGWVDKLRSGEEGEALDALVDRVDLTGSGFKLTLRLPALLKDSSDALTLERLVPITMKRRGVELKLVIENEPSSRAKVDLVLLKTIARAYRWFDELVSGEVKSLTAIAARDGLSYRFVGKVIRLAFLAPEIVEAIAEGKQPPEFSTELLTKHTRLPLDWDDQKRLLDIG